MTKFNPQESPEASKESKKSARTSYFYYYCVHFFKNNKATLRYLDLGAWAPACKWNLSLIFSSLDWAQSKVTVGVKIMTKFNLQVS